MKILFTICGRAGSKGIKNKNIKDFLDVKLPYYSLAAVDLYLKKHSEIEAEVAVNTDSMELMKLMEENKLLKVTNLERSVEMASDYAPKSDVILDCLERMEQIKGKSYDMVVDLDITSPLRTVKDVENLINKFIESKCELVFSVTTARRNPYFNMVKKTDHGYKRVLDSDFTARQQAPEIFDMNASLYAYAPEFLRKKISILDGYCEVIMMYDTGILDLDHENDFELMEVIAEHLFKSNEEFGEIQHRAQEA